MSGQGAAQHDRKRRPAAFNPRRFLAFPNAGGQGTCRTRKHAFAPASRLLIARPAWLSLQTGGRPVDIASKRLSNRAPRLLQIGKNDVQTRPLFRNQNVVQWKKPRCPKQLVFLGDLEYRRSSRAERRITQSRQRSSSGL